MVSSTPKQSGKAKTTPSATPATLKRNGSLLSFFKPKDANAGASNNAAAVQSGMKMKSSAIDIPRKQKSTSTHSSSSITPAPSSDAIGPVEDDEIDMVLNENGEDSLPSPITPAAINENTAVKSSGGVIVPIGLSSPTAGRVSSITLQHKFENIANGISGSSRRK
jgi:hypothetical protein